MLIGCVGVGRIFCHYLVSFAIAPLREAMLLLVPWIRNSEKALHLDVFVFIKRVGSDEMNEKNKRG